jgi:hypothetical protein
VVFFHYFIRGDLFPALRTEAGLVLVKVIAHYPDFHLVIHFFEDRFKHEYIFPVKRVSRMELRDDKYVSDLRVFTEEIVLKKPGRPVPERLRQVIKSCRENIRIDGGDFMIGHPYVDRGVERNKFLFGLTPDPGSYFFPVFQYSDI